MAEYQKLLEGLASEVAVKGMADEIPAPVLSEDALNEVVPGNIRKADHFVRFVERFRDHVKSCLATKTVVTQNPIQFLMELQEKTEIEAKPLRFCSDRLSSLIRNLQFENIEEFTPLKVLCDFATLVGTYQKGFSVIVEPFDERTPNIPDPVLQLACHDASIALKAVFETFRTVVITSGTLSPMEMYPKILGFNPVITTSLVMTMGRNCISPLILTRGSDQVPVTSKFDTRSDPAVIRNYGDALKELAMVTPDGIVAFFPSYRYLESVVSEWNKSKVLLSILEYKLIFIESPDVVETTLALDNYRKACDSGRGAILLSVARGKVSEGIDFKYHYGRAVIVFGVPFVYTESRVLKARLEYLREHYQIKEGDFLNFDALRSTAQCVGRVIRSKRDYAVMVFADKRYSRSEKRDKLPKWIKERFDPGCINLSTDGVVSICRNFFREMAQVRDNDEELGVSLWNREHLDKFQAKENKFAPPSDKLLPSGRKN